MSSDLTPAEKERYSSIIDGILATADLESVTRKKVRSGLETALGGKDLSDQKVAIRKLIEQRFDAISAAPTEPEPALALTLPKIGPASTWNSQKRKIDSDTNAGDKRGEPELDDDADEIKVSTQPPKKKHRRREATEDADAKLAAMLQAQENQGGGRATRGAGSKPKPKSKPVKKRPRQKSANKVRPEDDSDVDGNDVSGAKPRKAGGGFQKPFNLSSSLADVCGEQRLPRPQVVKKLWEHIKANDLQDPKDKRQILCDDKLLAIFKQSKIDMFQMNKLVGSHLYPVEDEEP